MTKSRVSSSKVITGWVSKIVDLAENLIFLGRVERVWNNLVAKSQLQQNENILDAGCGTGAVVVKSADKILPDGLIYGIDASHEMIEIAQKKLKNSALQKSNVTFLQASMEMLPFKDNYFDVILSCQALHHLPSNLKIEAFKEMKRVLKPAGRVVICDHGKPYNWFLKIVLFPFRWNIFEYQGDNFRGKIPQYLESIFNNVEELDRFFGWMKIWESIKQ